MIKVTENEQNERSIAQFIDKQSNDKQIKAETHCSINKQCLIIAIILLISCVLLIFEEGRVNEFQKETVLLHQKLEKLKQAGTSTQEIFQKYISTVSQLKLIHQEQSQRYSKTIMKTQEQLQSDRKSVEGLRNEGRSTKEQLQRNIKTVEELKNEGRTTKEQLQRNSKTVEELRNEGKTTKEQLQRNIKNVEELRNQVTSLKTLQPQSKNIKKTKNQNGKVIDITYQDDKFGTLPIQFLKKNSEGKRIQEVMYDESARKKRQQYHKARINFIKGNNTKCPTCYQIYLSIHNMILNEEGLKTSLQENERQWLRLQDKFKLSKIERELPMCVITPGVNNKPNSRVQYNLNSVFSQNYTNYKVIIVNDASTDGSNELYRKYLQFYKIDKKLYTYIQNTQRVTALPNIYYAATEHCSKDSIIVGLDADDQFIGRNVLKVFNWGYQTKKSGFLYSDFYYYRQGERVGQEHTTEYTDDEKKYNRYRQARMRFHQLRSFRNQLLFQINVTDLQDTQGKFYKYAYDVVLFLPLMELACGRVNRIDGQVHYLYNANTGINDAYDPQIKADGEARAKKKYQCFKEFDEKMSAP